MVESRLGIRNLERQIRRGRGDTWTPERIEMTRHLSSDVNPEFLLSFSKRKKGEKLLQVVKFVRQGDRIVAGEFGAEHVEYAFVNGLLNPNDAGVLQVEDGKSDIIIHPTGSGSMEIDYPNPNRPNTLIILQTIAEQAGLRVVEAPST